MIISLTILYVIVVRWRRVVYVAREWLVSIDHEGEARVGLCKQKPRACHVNHKQSAIVQVSCMIRCTSVSLFGSVLQLTNGVGLSLLCSTFLAIMLFLNSV